MNAIQTDQRAAAIATLAALGLTGQHVDTGGTCDAIGVEFPHWANADGEGLRMLVVNSDGEIVEHFTGWWWAGIDSTVTWEVYGDRESAPDMTKRDDADLRPLVAELYTATFGILQY